MNLRFKLLLVPTLVCALAGHGALQAAPDQSQAPAQKAAPKIDLNSAAERELMRLPDITFPLVRKIIANRPYKATHELVSKGIISEASYSRMRDLIMVKEPPRHLALPGPRFEKVELLRGGD